MGDYEVVHTEDVPIQDLAESDESPADQEVRNVDEVLGAENVRVKVWHIDPGEEIGYHAHAEQEELFYVLSGTFSLKLGRSGEEEYVEVGPGAFWRAGPEIGHGHRNVGDERATVIAIGAPPVADPGLDPHSLD